MPRPISATIHLSALENNLAVARRLSPASKVWAVVKANAYGHGIERVYPALSDADGFALLDLDEAVRLRELGWEKPILLLEGFFDETDVPLLASLRLTTAVHDEAQLRMLELASRSGQLPRGAIDVFLKLNSGMNRLGFAPEQYRAAFRRAQEVEAIGTLGHMSHFADADTETGISAQWECFRATTQGLPGPVSLANSAATLWHHECRYDWVRAGIMLYGASPSGNARDLAGTGLQPTQTLASRILGVQQIEAGQAVGYGSHYVATRRQRIGIVACGYADGYPRIASSHAGHFAPVRVGERMTRTLGRVSMDMLAVDLEACPEANVGTPVELWGKHVPIDDVAAAAGTIGYELMCAVAPRVPVRVWP